MASVSKTALQPRGNSEPGSDAFGAEDLRALAWLRDGMTHYVRLIEPHNLQEILDAIDRHYANVEAAFRGRDPSLQGHVADFMEYLLRFRRQPVYILMGFHGGMLFEDDEFGYCEFDSPQMAYDKIIRILDLATVCGVPLILEFALFSLDALCRRFPDLVGRLRDAIDAGLAEIVNTTLSHPYTHLIGAESNIRQFVYGGDLYRRLFGREAEVYVCSEFAIHPQLPQILRQVGIRAAGIRSRLQGIGPSSTYPLVEWQGADGTIVRALTHQTNLFCGEYYASIFYKEIFSQLLQAASGPNRQYAVMTTLVDHTVELEDDVEEALRSSRFGPILGNHVTYGHLFSEGPEPHARFRFSYDQFDTTPQPCERLGGLGHRLQLESARAERRLLIVEGLLARMMLLGRPVEDCLPALDDAWNALLCAQNHDAFAVPYYRPGQYHRERLHLNAENFTPYVEPIPLGGETVGDRALRLVAEACGFLETALAQTVANWGEASEPDRQVWLNPHGFEVDGLAPGLSDGPADKASLANAKVSAGMDQDKLNVRLGESLKLQLEIRDEKGERLPLEAVPGEQGELRVDDKLSIRMSASGNGLELNLESRADGIRLCWSGFPAGSEFWCNYPLGAEPTHKRRFTASDFVWVKGAFLMLSTANPYYESDLERTWLANNLYDRGQYSVRIEPDLGLDLPQVGRRMIRYQLPPVQWSIPALGGPLSAGPVLDSETVYLQAVIPQADRLLLRLINFSGQAAVARINLPAPWRLGRQVNCVGQSDGKQPLGDQIELGPWAFGTFEVVR